MLSLFGLTSFGWLHTRALLTVCETHGEKQGWLYSWGGKKCGHRNLRQLPCACSLVQTKILRFGYLPSFNSLFFFPGVSLLSGAHMYTNLQMTHLRYKKQMMMNNRKPNHLHSCLCYARITKTLPTVRILTVVVLRL